MNRAQIEKEYVEATKPDWKKFTDELKKLPDPLLGSDNMSVYSDKALLLYNNFRKNTIPQFELYEREIENLHPSMNM